MSTSEDNLPDHLILELPSGEDFVSTPPAYSVIEMIRICEAMLPHWNRRRFVESEAEGDALPPDAEPFRL